MMPEANPIPYSVLFENKKWREAAKDTLAANQALVNSAFEDVRATNENDAAILEQKNKYYSTKRDEILNDPKMNTREKYRAMNILGTEAANDTELTQIRKFTEGYQTNKKLLEESANLMDEDVQRAVMDRLEEQNRMGIGKPGQYMAGNTFNTIKGIETPDIAKDTQEFLKGMAENATITSKNPVNGQPVILRKDVQGYYNETEKKYITDEEAASIARGYIAQSPKYKEFFALKDAGAEANLRNYYAEIGLSKRTIDDLIKKRKQEYGGTVYDKKLYIEQGVLPTSKYIGFSQETGKVVPDKAWDEEQRRKAAAEAKEEEVVDNPITYTSTPQGVTTQDQDVINDAAQYQTKVANLTTALNEANQKLLDVESGREVATKEQIELYKFQASKASQDLKNIQNIYDTKANAEIAAGTYAGSRFDVLQKHKDRKIINEAGDIDIWAGDGDNIIPGTNIRLKNSADGFNDFDELWEISSDAAAKGTNKHTGWSDLYMPYIKNIFAPDLEEDRVTAMFRRAIINKENITTAMVDNIVSQIQSGNVTLEGTPWGESAKAYKVLMGADLPKDYKKAKKLLDALTQTRFNGNASVLYKEMVKNGKPKKEAEALSKMLEAMSYEDDYKTMDIDDFLKNGVERNVEATTNYFNHYLNKNKQSIVPQTPVFLDIPSLADKENQQLKANIASRIQNKLSNFVVTNATTGEVLNVEELQEKGIEIKDVVSVGMDEMYYGDGEDQRLPLSVTGEVTETKDTKKKLELILYGTRQNNPNVYGAIADYLETNKFADTQKESRMDPITGELIPNTDRRQTQYTIDLLRNKHTIDDAFEQRINNTPIQGTGTFSFGTFANVQSTRLANGEVLKSVDPNTVDIKYTKTGPNNYIFSATESTNPILQMRTAMIRNIDGFEDMLNSLPESVPPAQLQNMTAEDRSMYQSLLYMKRSYDVLKNNDFKVELDKEVDAKLYLRRLQEVYNSMYKNLNTDINNYYKLAELLTR